MSLAGGFFRRNMYAVVGSRTATTPAWAIASIPSSLISSRWLIARAPSSAPSWNRLPNNYHNYGICEIAALIGWLSLLYPNIIPDNCQRSLSEFMSFHSETSHFPSLCKFQCDCHLLHSFPDDFGRAQGITHDSEVSGCWIWWGVGRDLYGEGKHWPCWLSAIYVVPTGSTPTCVLYGSVGMVLWHTSLQFCTVALHCDSVLVSGIGINEGKG